MWCALLAIIPLETILQNEDGFEMQREGIKKAAKDSILTPRFYTTDFEECARILSTDINPGLNLRELEAMREEFVKDYNQNHFIRNDKFKPAAAAVQGVISPLSFP